jgi:dihydrolipoamide dehydrogenase
LNATNKYAELGSLRKLGISFDGSSMDLKTLMEFKDRTVSGLTRGIESLFKKNGTTFIHGRASFISANELSIGDDTERVTAKYIIIATGSEPSPFPGKVNLPIDGDRIVTSDQAIAFSEIPKNLVVVGGGVIGLELGSVWARLGSKVAVLDRSTPLSFADKEMSTALVKSLRSHEGMRFLDGSEITQLHEGAIDVEMNGSHETLEFDKLLVSTGRRPVTQGLGIEHIGITTDKRGHIEVNDKLQTKSHPHIFAIGDVAPGPMLAHKAEEEGVAVVDYIHNPETAHFPNHLHIPSVVYTSPELAWVGHTEEELVSKGIQYRKGSFPFMANSRARCNGQTEGFVKILASHDDDKLLGAHILSPHAGELIAPLVTGITYGASSRDIAMVSHAHPTETEAIKEACFAAHFKATHI